MTIAIAAKYAFVLPDGPAAQQAIHALASSLGAKMPAFCTASFVPLGTKVVDGFQGKTLVIVNGAIAPHTHLAPVGRTACCGDTSHGDMALYGHNFAYLDIDVQGIINTATQDIQALHAYDQDNLRAYIL